MGQLPKAIVPGVDGAGTVLLRQRLSRARLLPFFEKLPRCLVRPELGWVLLLMQGGRPRALYIGD